MTITETGADHITCVGALSIDQRRKRIHTLADLAADLDDTTWADLQIGFEIAVNRYAPALLITRGVAFQRFADLIDAIREQGRCCGNVADYADRLGWEGTLDQLEEQILTAVDDALDACFEVAG